jgi:hypothetical protein
MGVQNMSAMKEKIQNAYLLLYERVVHFEEDPQASDLVNGNGVSSPLTGSASSPSTIGKKSLNGAPLALRRKQKEILTASHDAELLKSQNVPQDYLKEIYEENRSYYLNQYLFAREYFDFMTHLVLDNRNELKENKDYLDSIQSIKYAFNSPEALSLEIIKTAAIFLFTSIMRDRDKHGIFKVLPFLKQALAQVQHFLQEILDISLFF